MTRGRFFKALILLHGMRWIVAILIGVAIGIALSITVGFEALIVVLMVIFMVWPMMMVFLYFYYGLKPLTLLNTTPHTLSLGEEGLKILLTETERETEVSYDDLAFHSEYDNGVIYRSKAGKGWIWIGGETFGDRERVADFVGRLNLKIPQLEKEKAGEEIRQENDETNPG